MDYVVKRPTSAPPEVKEELEETKVQFVLFVLFVLLVCLNRPRLKKGVNSRLLENCITLRVETLHRLQLQRLSNHRLHMELGLQTLFGRHVCTAVLIG